MSQGSQGGGVSWKGLGAGGLGVPESLRLVAPSLSSLYPNHLRDLKKVISAEATRVII